MLSSKHACDALPLLQILACNIQLPLSDAGIDNHSIHICTSALGVDSGVLMMREDHNELSTAFPDDLRRSRAVTDLPLISRDDATWEEFDGPACIAQTALQGN